MDDRLLTSLPHKHAACVVSKLLCVQARSVAEGIIASVALLSQSGLPCYGRGQPIANLRKRFCLDMSQAQAAAYMLGKINGAYDNVRALLCCLACLLLRLRVCLRPVCARSSAQDSTTGCSISRTPSPSEERGGGASWFTGWASLVLRYHAWIWEQAVLFSRLSGLSGGSHCCPANPTSSC